MSDISWLPFNGQTEPCVSAPQKHFCPQETFSVSPGMPPSVRQKQKEHQQGAIVDGKQTIGIQLLIFKYLSAFYLSVLGDIALK